MSHYKIKDVQKIRNQVILYFSDADRSLWGDTMSVTIPLADANKLLTRLQTTLRSGGASDN